MRFLCFSFQPNNSWQTKTPQRERTDAPDNAISSRCTATIRRDTCTAAGTESKEAEIFSQGLPFAFMYSARCVYKTVAWHGARAKWSDLPLELPTVFKMQKADCPKTITQEGGAHRIPEDNQLISGILLLGDRKSLRPPEAKTKPLRT